MSRFIENIPKEQLSFFSFSIDDLIRKNSIVYVIDAFTSNLNLVDLEFIRAVPNAKGAPSYDPKDLLNLYIYGHLRKIRSSRNLEEATYVNNEVIWLLNSLHPDHNTISDFRKDNRKALKKVFIAFNKMALDLDLFSKDLDSQDGTKLRANNSKDNNFTVSKLDDRLIRANKKVEQYLADLDKTDDANEICSINQNIDIVQQKIKKYQSLLNDLEKSKESQVSLVDPQSRLMKQPNGGFDVSYNIQTSVDSKHHLISDFEVTNNPSDNGLMLSLATEVKDLYGSDTLEHLVDGGYVNEDDINNCLDNKIIPILPEHSSGAYTIKRDFVDNVIDNETKKGSTLKDVKTCLDAGIIPECYSYLDMSISVEESLETVDIDPLEDVVDNSLSKEGYFVRDINNDKVICPAGNILRKKCTTKGKTRYYNSTACLSCKNKCTESKIRYADFSPNQVLLGCQKLGTRSPGINRKKNKVTKVIISYKPDKVKYKNRKNLSEHPFGTLKRYNDGSYLLLQGKEKIPGELALSFLAYNIKRVVNILGVDNLVKYLKNPTEYQNYEELLHI